MTANGITLYKSPEYASKYTDWQRYSDLYYGVHSTVCSANYLYYHKIESAGDAQALKLRASREQRTRYLNLPEIIVSLWQSLLFRSEPVFDAAALSNLDGAEDDIDGAGTSFCSWLRDFACRNYLVYGQVIALTDAFPFTATSKADERARGLRPFVELLEPLAVVDWQIETSDPARIGKYNFLRHEYDVTLPRLRSSDRPTVRRQSSELSLVDGRYTVTQYNGPEYDVDSNGNVKASGIVSNQTAPWSLGETISTELLELPISVINSESWIDGVCEETLRHHNIRSNKDNILYNQGFDQVFIKGINAKDIPEFVAAMNEYSKILLPENGDAFKLDANDVAAYERAEAQALDAVFKVGLNQLHSLPGDSKLIAAADSQDAQKDNTYAIIESAVEQLENFANDILVKFAEFKGNKNPGQVEFNRDIKESNVDEFLAVWSGFREMFRGIPEIEKPATKKAVERLGLSEDELEAAASAVDKKDFTQPTQNALAGRRADTVAAALNGGAPNAGQQ